MTEAVTPAPLFSIVAGNPTDEEVAALVTVLAAGGSTGTAESGPCDMWGNAHDQLRPQPGLISPHNAITPHFR